MRITEVEVRNVKRIKYVKLTPDGSITIVGGDNEQGKTSLLDAVCMALGGKKLCPKKPIRKGCKSGTVSLHVDGDEDLMIPPSTIIRHFEATENGSYKSELEIVSDDGYKSPEPQTTLDRLLSTATFDPLYFQRLKPKQQADALRELIGLDTGQIDAKRAMIYETRRLAGRDAKQLEGQLAGLPPFHEDAPEAPQSSQELLEELAKVRATNEQNAVERRTVAQLHDKATAVGRRVEQGREYCENMRKQLEAATEKLRKLEEELADEQKAAAEAEERAKALEDKPTQLLETSLAEVDTINAKVRDNQEREKVAAQLAETKGRCEDLSEELGKIDAEKVELFLNAEWPIEGLAFGDDGITYREVPFEQCSSAEQLRVSVAMGFALNPKLKILVIRDGSLLDENSLLQVATMAAAEEGHVFLERVGQGEECDLILKDGEAMEEVAKTEE